MGANQSPSRKKWIFQAPRTRADAVLWLGAMLSLTLAGCASTPSRTTGSAGVVNAQSGCHAPPPNLRAAYNRPYSVKGSTYTPLRSADGYEEVGTASWYGWESGATTSMGTRFNPRDFSAASRVLPLPTCVQVTNLDNGLSALVLVNDRGPFVSSRILDLSMGAAAALGITRTGTAQVRIVALPEGANAPLQMAIQSQSMVPDSKAAAAPMEHASSTDRDVAAPEQFAPSIPAQVPPTQRVSAAVPIELQVLPPLPTPLRQASAPSSSMREAPPAVGQQLPMPQPALTLPSDFTLVSPPASVGVQQQGMVLANTPQTFLQTGAFTLEANAQTEKARMQSAGIDDVLVVPGYVRGQMFYRVQIGPLNGSPDAGLLQKLQSLGLAQYSVIQQ